MSFIFPIYLLSTSCAHTCYINTAQNKISLRTSHRTSRISRSTFPQSATCGVGWSVARISANWNAYLFMLWLSTWSVIINFDTLWHCFCYSLLSSYVCNLILAHIWFIAQFIPSKSNVTFVRPLLNFHSSSATAHGVRWAKTSRPPPQNCVVHQGC